MPSPAGALPRASDETPYLQRLESFGNAFPALNTFLEKLLRDNDAGRKAVKNHYLGGHQRGPGRCYCLIFDQQSVSLLNEEGFKDAAALRTYLEENPATYSRETKNHRRLFILEDMEPDYVDALGYHLGVDPLVFTEQANTWNFTNSWSIPHRGLPSMSFPEQSFTLRYYELRTLFNPRSVDRLSMQMTFAANRRRYERWRDIDVPSAGQPDRRHAFVRRCASFWTSQDPTLKEKQNSTNDAAGWDALILVDPPFAITSKSPIVTSARTSVTNPVTATFTAGVNNTNMGTSPKTSPAGMNTPAINSDVAEKTNVDQAVADGMEQCLILQDPNKYPNRVSLWEAQQWGKTQALEPTIHSSWPYHNGCSTLAPLMFSQVGIGAEKDHIQKYQIKRDLVSPLEETIFCWTKLASHGLIGKANAESSNAAYYLLKHIAQHWVHQLELINTTIAKGEWFSDDYQAKIDDDLSSLKWKADLIKINDIANDINYMRRHLNHFWRAMVLNLERLGVQLGSEGVDDNMSLALRDAQKDFLTIHTRMQPLRDRAEALNSVAQDLANLRAAFRGVHDGEFGLRLSLFASIIFPLTLVASIFSMDNEYEPGKSEFWKLWAIGIPFCLALALALIYGTRPWRIFDDLREYVMIRLKAHADKRKRKKEDEAQTKLVGTSKEHLKYGKRAAKSNSDEEQG